MNWTSIKENRIYQFFTNKYVLIGSIFIVWMIFFDNSSVLEHVRISRQINELENDKEFYEQELQRVHKALYKVKHDPRAIERIARERFFMKRDNEDIFVVVEDSVAK